MKDSILFVQTSRGISSNDFETTFHSRRFILFNDNEPWIKEDGNGDFDVILRSHDRAEVYELVWVLVLNELPKRFDKENIGLYK